jgi:hypothetical protein
MAKNSRDTTGSGGTNQKSTRRNSERGRPCSLQEWLDEGKGGPLWVVTGGGTAALWSVVLHRAAGRRVLWIETKGSRLLPVLPTIPNHPGLTQFFMSHAEVWGEPRAGSFLREFRNKAFREPSWMRTEQSPREVVWAPELRFLISDERRLTKTYLEIEDELRASLLEGTDFRREESSPLIEVEGLESGELRLVLGTGEQFNAQGLDWTDTWNKLRNVEGLAKLTASTIRKREPTGILQVVFTHNRSIGPMDEAVFATLSRDSGGNSGKEAKEDEYSGDRRVWGYFTSTGLKSIWTLALSTDEIEDNHEIGKKIRKLKQCLEKIFGVEPWVSSGLESFSTTVVSEQVRLLENFIFQGGNALASPIEFSSLPGFRLMTEGYGLESSLEQVLGETDLGAQLSGFLALMDSSEELPGVGALPPRHEVSDAAPLP